MTQVEELAHVRPGTWRTNTHDLACWHQEGWWQKAWLTMFKVWFNGDFLPDFNGDFT
jgi:hypothetical protein